MIARVDSLTSVDGARTPEDRAASVVGVIGRTGGRAPSEMELVSGALPPASAHGAAAYGLGRAAVAEAPRLP